MKLGIRYSTPYGGIQLEREKHHIKVLSRDMPVRIREFKVRKLGLIKAIKHVRAIALKQKKQHLVKRYDHLLLILEDLRTCAGKPAAQ